MTCGAREIPSDGWRLAKARSLVKILALAPGQSLLRDQLIDMLWPELAPDAGTNNLHQVLHVARRTLAELLPDAKPQAIIRLRRGVLSLDPPTPLWVDAAAFERRAAELATSNDPAAFYPVLDLYRGDLLPDDLYEEWAADRRTALRELYLDLLDRLAALHAERREATPAIDALRRLVAIEPDREEAHRALMELYALTGRRQQALRQYERAREILERELELEPEPETDALYAAILAGDFPAETWGAEAPPEPATAPRLEIVESIAEFLGRAGDFVGRGEELSKLQRALERVVANQGQIILIAGEPGIGKTRMSEEFLRYAGAQGVRTLWGRCYEGDGAPAYWPWVQIVRAYLEGRTTAEIRTVMGAGAADIARIAPELRERLPDLPEPPPLDPDGERFRLFDSMATFLKSAAARAPLALVIDDLHSADRSSLLLLEFLAREIATAGLLIVGTYRHVEIDRGHPLTRTLGQLARHDANERITLDGLTVGDIARYVLLVTGREAPEGLAEAIHDQTEGNPFFVREIVALLMEEERLSNPDDVRSWRLTIPHGIRETVALRTARLSDTAHRVLTTASVSGRDFELPIVARVAGLEELDTLDALEEALATGLILESPPTPGGFRFTHAITRETLYDEISHSRRRRMHLRTGEALEDLGGASEARFSELAHHFLIAAPLGVSDKAIEYLQAAGAQAMTAIAYGEAAEYFEQALGILEAQPDFDIYRQHELLLQVGQALRSAGDTHSALDAHEQAVATARLLDDPVLFAQTAIGTADTAFQLGDYEATYIPLLEEARERLDGRDDHLRVQILAALVRDIAASNVAIPDGAERIQQMVEEALSVAERAQSAEITMRARIARHYVLGDAVSNVERLRNTEEIIDLARELNDREQLLLCHAWRIFEFIEAGEIEAANRENDAYLEIAREVRKPRNIWAATFRQAMHALARGEFGRAEELATNALSIGQRAAPVQAFGAYVTQMAAIYREQDRASEILEHASRVAAQHPSLSHYAILLHALRTELGDCDAAIDELSRLAAEEFRAIPRNLIWLPNIVMLSVAAVNIGAPDMIRLLYELLEPYQGRIVSGGGNVVIYGGTSYYLGLLATANADWPAAVKHLEYAREQHARVGLRPYTAHAEVALARALLMQDEARDHQRASELLRAAQGEAEALGMARLQRQIAMLRQFSAQPAT